MPHFSVRTSTNTSGQFESAVLSNETSQVADMRVSERDGAGRVLKLDSAFSLPNLTRKYDDIGRLSMQSFEASAPQSYEYLDNSSKLSKQNLLTGNLTYQYDLATGRFTSSNQASYSYETTTALPVDGRGQQSQNYDFNEWGQRTCSLVGTSSATLGWSGERLTSFETSDTSANYIYDSSGMRVKSSVTHLGATSDTSYAYDGLRLMELSQSGANPYRIGYLYEAQNTIPYAASYESSGTALSFTLESNVRGDVIALRDTLGNVFATYSYGDYGEPHAITTNETELVSADLAKDVATRQVLRYAGYLYDDYSGMYYCAARYYDPTTQVFISLDPVRADGERSGYLYCSGDPINQTDPSGKFVVLAVPPAVYLLAVGGGALGAYYSLPPSSRDKLLVAIGYGLDGLINRMTISLNAIIALDHYAKSKIQTAVLHASEHKKNARPSTKNKHQKGQTRKQQDQQRKLKLKYRRK